MVVITDYIKACLEIEKICSRYFFPAEASRKRTKNGLCSLIKEDVIISPAVSKQTRTELRLSESDRGVNYPGTNTQLARSNLKANRMPSQPHTLSSVTVLAPKATASPTSLVFANGIDMRRPLWTEKMSTARDTARYVNNIALIHDAGVSERG